MPWAFLERLVPFRKEPIYKNQRMADRFLTCYHLEDQSISFTLETKLFKALSVEFEGFFYNSLEMGRNMLLGR